MIYGVFGGITNGGQPWLANLDLFGTSGQGGSVYYDNPTFFAKPDFFQVTAPLTAASGLPRVDAATGGSVTLEGNGSYLDENSLSLIVASFSGPGPSPNPWGPNPLPFGYPDSVVDFFIANAGTLGALHTFGEYGERGSSTSVTLPRFGSLIGTGFTIAFAAVPLDVFTTPGTLSIPWSVGQLVEYN